MIERSASMRLANSLLPITLALSVGGVVAIAFGAGSMRQGVIALAAIGFIGCAYLSGRPRLICLWGLMVTLPLNLSKSFTAFSTRGGGETAIKAEMADIFLGVLTVFLALELLSGRRVALRVPRVTWVWLLLMGLGVVTVFFGDFRQVAAFEVFRMGKVLLLFVVLANELRSRGVVLHACCGLALGVLLQASVGFAQYVKGANLGLEMFGETNQTTIEILSRNSVQGMEVWRVSGLSLHPNLFGIYLAATLPMLTALFLVHIGTLMRVFALVGCALGAISLLATFSRSSWVSFALAISTFLTLTLIHRGMRKRAAVPTALAAVLMAGILVVFSGQITQRLFNSQEDATIGRHIFNEDAQRLIAEKPFFGWGINSYVDVVLEYAKYSREAQGYWIPPVHHIYYLWWSEMGIVGLTLHIAVIVLVLYVGVKNLKIRDPMLYTLSAACMCGVLAFLVDGFFSFSLRVGSILRLFWGLAGIIMAIHYLAIRGETGAHRYGDPPAEPDDPATGQARHSGMFKRPAATMFALPDRRTP